MLQSHTDNRRTIGSYWEASVPEPRLDRQLIGNALFDVAVVGAGYAGLSAALKLAQAGVSVCVLEVEHVGYGASGRNGGFCCLGGTKLNERQLIRAFGLEEARKFVAFQVAGVNLVAHRLDSWGVDADRHSKGEVFLAHRPKDTAGLQSEGAFLKETFGIKTRYLSKDDLDAEGHGGPGFHGGLHVPYGFALNPMAYVQALAEQVRTAGGKIFGKSPVTALSQDGDRWRLETGYGLVRAKKVVLAGNGYAREDVPKWLHGRTLPVMSSIQVTRPLSEDELSAQGWTSDTMSADTRILLHYFRLLPDRRFLFGTRGGIFRKRTLSGGNAQARAVRLRKHVSRLGACGGGIQLVRACLPCAQTDAFCRRGAGHGGGLCGHGLARQRHRHGLDLRRKDRRPDHRKAAPGGPAGAPAAAVRKISPAGPAQALSAGRLLVVRDQGQVTGSVHLRPASLLDLEALYAICLRTGDAGKDASGLYSDPRLMGHIYAAPYVALDGLICLVAEDAGGVLQDMWRAPRIPGTLKGVWKRNGGRPCASHMPSPKVTGLPGRRTSSASGRSFTPHRFRMKSPGVIRPTST
ncbi:FAD-dependent oxidoreductase [Roseibium salinum]|nr:FAD-dependent oxidoreductase [Roseibium salinum]